LAMRRVLVDFARSRLAQRRGDGEAPTSLDENTLNRLPGNTDLESLVLIGSLMDQLEKANLGASRVVDLHYFAGFTLDEIAEITGLSLRQVRHRWEKGRDWLRDRM
jgi:RNA polymerase sigma factor (sigma-70 family)